MNRQIALAEELFQRRLESYWKNLEQMSPDAPIQGGKWRGSINEHTAREWMQDCLKLAKTMIDAEEAYFTENTKPEDHKVTAL